MSIYNLNGDLIEKDAIKLELNRPACGVFIKEELFLYYLINVRLGKFYIKNYRSKKLYLLLSQRVVLRVVVSNGLFGNFILNIKPL